MEIVNYGGATCSLSGELLKKIMTYRNNYKVIVIKKGEEIEVPPCYVEEGFHTSDIEVLEFDEGVVVFVKKFETIEVLFL